MGLQLQVMARDIDVAHGAIKGWREDPGGAAEILHGIDGCKRRARGEHYREARTGDGLDIQRVAGAHGIPCACHFAVQIGATCFNGSLGFGETRLHAGFLARRARTGKGRAVKQRQHRVHRTARHAAHRSGLAHGEAQAERHAPCRVVVLRRVAQTEAVGGGHEHIVQAEIVAGGALQAAGMPGVDQEGVATRYEHDAHLRHTRGSEAWLLAVMHHA